MYFLFNLFDLFVVFYFARVANVYIYLFIYFSLLFSLYCCLVPSFLCVFFFTFVYESLTCTFVSLFSMFCFFNICPLYLLSFLLILIVSWNIFFPFFRFKANMHLFIYLFI